MTAKKTIKIINGVFLSFLSSLIMLLCIIQFFQGTAAAKEKEKIAVWNCENAVEGASASEYAKGVGDTISDIFTRSTVLVLLERSQIDAAIAERNDAVKEGGVAKAFGEEDVAKIGQSLGATKIVVSKLTKSKTNLMLAARLIDVGSRQVVASVKEQANINDSDFLAEKVADALLKKFTKESVLTDKERQDIAQMDIPQEEKEKMKEEKEKMKKAKKREEEKQEAQEVLGTIGGVFGGMLNAVGNGNAKK